MKKLLALLLALLLPCCAAAETYELSVSVELDEELFSLYASEMVQLDPELSAYDPDKLMDVVVKCLDGAGICIAAQANAAALTLNLAGGELMQLVLHMAEDAVYMTSPMLSGYAIVGDAADKLLAEQIVSTDWETLLTGVKRALDGWRSELVAAESAGVFSGDAYEGGTKCMTWVLSDKDIAALVSALATDELRALAVPVLESVRLDAAELLAQFDALNEKVAEEDKFLYMLRIVSNDAGEYVGASLTVLDEKSQLATVSLGLTETELKLVVGMGLDEQNYWWEFTGKKSQIQKNTYLSGTSREWIADKLEGFSYVCATNAPLSDYTWRCTVTNLGNRYIWNGNISVGDVVYYEYLLSFSGSYVMKTNALDCSISLGGAPYEPVKLNIQYGPVKEIAQFDNTLQLCSLSDPADAALYQELVEKFSASIMARLIKLLPMDLIMTMNEFTLPVE